jgi:uncharacterized membrane protein
MNKRILAAVLWFFAGWYGWNLLAEFAGVTFMLGPVIGAVAAAFIAGDPFHLIWTERWTSTQPERVGTESA